MIRFGLNHSLRVLDTADVYALGSDDLHYGEYLVRRVLKSWKGPQDEVKVLTKVGPTRP